MANINEKGIPENASDINVALEKMVATVDQLVFKTTDGEHKRVIGIPYYVRLEMRGKRKAYAWVSKNMVWWSKKGQYAYEMCIATESMSRPAEELFLTIVHEMVHLANQTDGIKDCADSSDRHNIEFKKACDDVGLACEQIGKKGFFTTHKIADCALSLQKAFKQYLEDCKEELKLFNVCGGYDESEMAIASMGKADGGNFLKMVAEAKQKAEEEKANKKKKGNNAIKYQCPGCKASFRATSKLVVKCVPCDCLFVEQVKEDKANTNGGEELPKAADK